MMVTESLNQNSSLLAFESDQMRGIWVINNMEKITADGLI